MAAPSQAPTISVDEYLRSSYRPDCDYVDGFVEERNLGEFDHGRLQTLLAIWFGSFERDWGIRVVVEQRVQVSDTRFRIPDVCILRRSLSVEQIIRHAPLVCIEILSPEDTVQRTRVRVADFHLMGVENVWILDPKSREGLVCTPSGWNKPADDRLVVPGTEVFLPLDKVFADLSED